MYAPNYISLTAYCVHEWWIVLQKKKLFIRSPIGWIVGVMIYTGVFGNFKFYFYFLKINLFFIFLKLFCSLASKSDFLKIKKYYFDIFLSKKTF
jgi:hypothetical protein